MIFLCFFPQQDDVFMYEGEDKKSVIGSPGDSLQNPIPRSKQSQLPVNSRGKQKIPSHSSRWLTKCFWSPYPGKGLMENSLAKYFFSWRGEHNS